YVEAGADCIFFEAPLNADEMRLVRDEVDAPLLANMVEGGKTPWFTVPELEELGFGLVIYPLSGWMAAAAVLRELMKELRAKGTLAPEERAALLRAAAEALAQRREEFAVGITREAGVCLKESRREVERACGNLLVAAEEATRINGEALPVGTGGSRKLALTVREPVGVVCAITPFNR